MNQSISSHLLQQSQFPIDNFLWLVLLGFPGRFPETVSQNRGISLFKILFWSYTNLSPEEFNFWDITMNSTCMCDSITTKSQNKLHLNWILFDFLWLALETFGSYFPLKFICSWGSSIFKFFSCYFCSVTLILKLVFNFFFPICCVVCTYLSHSNK